MASQVQRRLEERGFFRGIIDGVWGPRSRMALREFKALNQLGSDDAWDLKTQLALFSDGYRTASLDHVSNISDLSGLFTPFAGSGTRLHSLNPHDASTIQERLFRLH